MFFFLSSILIISGCFCTEIDETIPDVPIFPTKYIAKGEIWLPYAEITEPFTAYFDGENNKSRIDYYGDTVITFQRADIKPYGAERKIVYSDTNERICFQVNGTENETVTVQSVVPDMSKENYSFVGERMYNKVLCNVWRIATRNKYGLEKLNTYTVWTTQGKHPVPVLFQMVGHNDLFGSHYDKYEVVYKSFKTMKKIPLEKFEVSNAYSCDEVDGNSTNILFNPMKEFISKDNSHVDDSFEEFKDKYNKGCGNETEHELRKNNFRHNLRFIHSTNRQGNSFTLAVNHLADRSDEEMKILRGRLSSNDEYNDGSEFPEHNKSHVPETYDWRLYGAVNPVRDQAICGSCWSFGTVGAIEGAYFVHTGHLIRLSEQALIDCSWHYHNFGCDGGEDYRAYKWIMNNTGIPLAEYYGPYLGQDGKCKHNADMKTIKISGYVNVTSGDSEALQAAIFYHGPVSVSIDANSKTFGFYSNGVYYEPKCRSDKEGLDHSVLAVGYGMLNGEKYWLIKNSWSTYWGNDGYILMSQKDNNCGVTTQPTYVTFD